MQVFKTYLKIVWRIKGQLMIYFGVFVAMALAFGLSGGSQGGAAFNETRTPVAWIEEGEPSALSEGLKAAIAPYANFVEIGQDPVSRQDALFYRKVEVILRVPEGFEPAFMQGGDAKLLRTAVPDSTSGYAIDARVEKYLNTVRVYRDNLPGLPAEELVGKALADLSVEAEATYFAGHVVDMRTTYCNNFFNYLSYTMLVIMILGVSTTLLAFHSKEIHRRNAASPVSAQSVSGQLFAGSLVLSAVISAAMFLMGIVVYRDVLTGRMMALIGANLVIFSVVALSISFLAANLIHGRNAASAVANVVSLGSSFISGAFVPQAMLGPSVLRIASFTPSYWFIKANNDIFTMSQLDWQGLSSVLTSMGVEALFAVAIFAVTQVYVRGRRA